MKYSIRNFTYIVSSTIICFEQKATFLMYDMVCVVERPGGRGKTGELLDEAAVLAQQAPHFVLDIE